MNTVTLNFRADGQQLVRTGSEKFAANTVNYIRAVFDLGDGWDGFDSVRAVWATDFAKIATVLDSDGACAVPWEVLKRVDTVMVNLVGSIADGDVLTDRLTTYKVKALDVNGCTNIAGTETAEITPSQFEQFVEAVANEVAKIKDISDVRLNDDYTLTFIFSDETEWTTPIPIRGEQGETGNGIASAVLNADYTLTLNFTDGTHYTTPPIRGVQGETGNGIADIQLTDTSGAFKTYTIFFTDGTTTTFEVTDGEVTNAVLDEATIVQTNEDSQPYFFRESGGGVTVGTKELSTIVGGTVAWNQLVLIKSTASQNGITFTNNGDGTYTVNGTATADAYFVLTGSATANHKYFTAVRGSTNVVFTQIGYPNTETKTSKIVSSAGTNPFGFKAFSGVSVSSEKVTPQLIDLTAMFGSTIADYIYSLEQATAGAGVAWFRNYFPDAYYPYDPGTLRSVEGVSAHETVGFNQWDEEWRNGYYDDGVFTPSLGYVANKNPIRVVPNTTYCLGSPQYGGYVSEYDASGAFIKRQGVAKNATFTVTSNTAFINFQMFGDYGGTYQHDICINLSDPSRNREYEPYVKHTYPLDSSLTLRGVPKLDNGNLYYDGDTYESDGTVTRKYGIVDLGTLNWVSAGGGDTYYATISDLKWETDGNVVVNAMCQKYVAVSKNYFGGNPTVQGVYRSDSGNPILYFRDSTYTSAAAFKTAMSGVYLVYELATPTTETADPYTSPQAVEQGGTEEFVTTGKVPVGHTTKYPLTLIDTMPTTNGTYTLNLTVANGKRSVSWT